jgi:hypothetical protein
MISLVESVGVLPGIMRLLGMVLKARLNGLYQQNPFFFVESGVPIVTPRVLSDRELQELMGTI